MSSNFLLDVPFSLYSGLKNRTVQQTVCFTIRNVILKLSEILKRKYAYVLFTYIGHTCAKGPSQSVFACLTNKQTTAILCAVLSSKSDKLFKSIFVLYTSYKHSKWFVFVGGKTLT